MRLNFGRKFGFGCSGLSPSCFLFSLVRRRARADTQIWFVTNVSDHFTHPQVLTKLLLTFSYIFPLSTSMHIVQTLFGSKNPPSFFIFFCFSSILIDSFFFFLSFFSFFFSFYFLLTNISNPR